MYQAVIEVTKFEINQIQDICPLDAKAYLTADTGHRSPGKAAQQALQAHGRALAWRSACCCADWSIVGSIGMSLSTIVHASLRDAALHPLSPSITYICTAQTHRSISVVSQVSVPHFAPYTGPRSESRSAVAVSAATMPATTATHPSTVSVAELRETVTRAVESLGYTEQDAPAIVEVSAPVHLQLSKLHVPAMFMTVWCAGAHVGRAAQQQSRLFQAGVRGPLTGPRGQASQRPTGERSVCQP